MGVMGLKVLALALGLAIIFFGLLWWFVSRATKRSHPRRRRHGGAG